MTLTIPQLASLNGMLFDVVVIGGGINGASAAQHLAAAGYRILLVEKQDFGSGSTSRSSRLLHCGLRYFEINSMLEFLGRPRRLAGALRMARQAMEARAELVTSAPERVRAMQFCFPLYRGGPYAGWQVDLAFRLLALLGPKSVPLDYRRVDRVSARDLPLVAGLRDFDAIESVAVFREYQMDWPERLCLDAVLDAERMGATVRNYTGARLLDRGTNGEWHVALHAVAATDRRENGVVGPSSGVIVRAPVVLNTTGIWIDQVNKAQTGDAKRRVLGTKGSHIVVRLPADCANYGIATLNRTGEPFYCVPWRDGLHYFGPTETVYEGDLDEIRPTAGEIDALLGEANHLLPRLRLARRDVVFSWAGVRPLTYDPALPKGNRSREIHDLTRDGMPGIFALTAGPVMTHRSAGRGLSAAVAARHPAFGPAQTPCYSARSFPENQNSPPLLHDDTTIKLADLQHAVAHEFAGTLSDVLFRRVGVAWSRRLSRAEVMAAARTVGAAAAWDGERCEAEASAFLDRLARLHPTGEALSITSDQVAGDSATTKSYRETAAQSGRA